MSSEYQKVKILFFIIIHLISFQIMRINKKIKLYLTTLPPSYVYRARNKISSHLNLEACLHSNFNFLTLAFAHMF